MASCSRTGGAVKRLVTECMKNKKSIVTIVCIVAVLVVAGIVIFGLLGGHGGPNPTDPTNTVPTTQGTDPTNPTTQGTQPTTVPGPTDPIDPTDPVGPTDPTGPVDPTDPANPTGPDHQHSYTTETVAPTCIDKGYTTYTCECGDTYGADPVDALGHDYKDETFKATCTKGGYTKHTCSRCDDTYTDNETEAKGHDYETKAKEATCEEGGYTKQVCKVCGDEVSESTTKAKGHKYGDWTTDKEPTCTTDGTASRTCGTCGKKETDTLGAYGHEFDDAVMIPATCTTDGYRQGTCVTCGEAVKETIPATGHDWGEWEITKEQTLVQDGEKQRTCKTCGEVEIEVIPKGEHEHDWQTRVVPPSGCTEVGYTETYCTGCDKVYRRDYVAAPGHDLTDWQTTKEAGPGVAGEEERHCRNCDYVETRPIDPTDYESYIDPRVKVIDLGVGRPSYRYGDRGEEVGRMQVNDSRTWGETPSIWVNDDNSLTVVWYNREGERVEVHMDPPPDPDTCYRSLTIKEDGTYHMVLNYYFT